MTEVRRRVSGWKIGGILFGAIVAVLVIFYLWVQSVASRRWEAMEKRVQELHLEAKGRDAARPVLRGEGVEGNAWDDYALALAEAGKFKGQDSVLGEFVSRRPKADRTKVEALLQTHSIALDHVRRGARRTNGQYPYAWEKGATVNTPGLLQCQRVANLAACKARLLAEEGRGREAAEVLLDTCQFGRDVGYNACLISEMIALAIYGIALEELRDLVLSGKLGVEELGQVDRELEILDRSFPQNGHSMVNEALAMGYTFLRGEVSLDDIVAVGGWAGAAALSGWRYAFSLRLMEADAFFVMERSMRRCAECEGKSWAEVQKVSGELTQEVNTTKNPIAGIVMPGLLGAARAGREKRVHLRFVRIAAHYRATGEVLELDDPFGAKIRSSKEGGKVKVWSLGRDGADNGGSGTWRLGTDQTDIVLEVGR